MFGRKKRPEPITGPHKVSYFTAFRWTRPFWGGLYIILGALVILYMPIGPIAVIIHAGIGGWAGIGCGLIMLVMGLFIWFVESQRILASIIAVLVSLASFPLSNLGGFVVGMMLGIIGGCMAFGWTPDKGVRKEPTPPPPVEDPYRPANQEGGGPEWDIGSFTERV